MTVQELASHLSTAFEGEGSRSIVRAAALDEAGPEEIAFVGHPKFYETAQHSPAGCLLVPLDYDNAEHRTLIRVPQPRAAFARVVSLLHPEPTRPAGIHPSAVIDASAELGEELSIGPHAVIGPGARIGSRTVIGAGVTVAENVQIGRECNIFPRVCLYRQTVLGDRVTLHAGSVIGADGFGFVFAGDRYEKFPQIGAVRIEDDVEIGANCCIDRAALGWTVIGQGTKLDNLVHVAHNCRIGRHVVVAAQTGLSGGVVIEDYAVVGGQVGIGDKARIESRAVLGSGCGVLTSKVIRSGQTVWGTPARPLKEYLGQLAALSRLPALRKEVADLRARLTQMEARRT